MDLKKLDAADLAACRLVEALNCLFCRMNVKEWAPITNFSYKRLPLPEGMNRAEEIRVAIYPDDWGEYSFFIFGRAFFSGDWLMELKIGMDASHLPRDFRYFSGHFKRAFPQWEFGDIGTSLRI